MISDIFGGLCIILYYLLLLIIIYVNLLNEMTNDLSLLKLPPLISPLHVRSKDQGSKGVYFSIHEYTKDLYYNTTIVPSNILICTYRVNSFVKIVSNSKFAISDIN